MIIKYKRFKKIYMTTSIFLKLILHRNIDFLPAFIEITLMSVALLMNC